MSVRVRSVTITGFKSFGEKVNLEFSPRVNAVVGPNGSGKSNVIEAIRWASYTARTRELRARTASELIFHGSLGKAQLNLAEVQLELENLHAGIRGLSIQRRLYRDGTTDLELAGKSVRVRDLHEVLRGSGLGPGGLAVVGQGEIGAVISADPETMLGYLEEAAGLSRATHRRAQTIDRLSQSRVHLTRLADVARELRGRVNRLEKEATTAFESQTLSAEAAVLEFAIHRQRVLIVVDEIKKLTLEMQTTQTLAQALSSTVQNFTTNLEALRQQRELVQANLARLSAEFEQLGGLVRALRERASAADAGLDAAKRERASLERESETLINLQSPILPEEPSDDLSALKSIFIESKNVVHNASIIETEYLNDLLNARTKRQLLERESAVMQSRIAAVGAERQTLERELESSIIELTDVATRMQLIQSESIECEVAFHAATKLLDRLEGDSQSFSDRILSTGTRILELKAGRVPLTKEYARLEASQQSKAYFGEGPRKVLTAGIDGVIGAVGDLLRVPKNLETSIGAALGRRVEQIVVLNGSVAEVAIDYLKRVGGRATFLPLEFIRVRARRTSDIFNEHGVLGIAADLIQTTHGTVVDTLLGDTIIIDFLPIALKLARKYPQRPRIVTLDGEILEPGGSVTGGRNGRDTFGERFSEVRRFTELRVELDTIEQELNKLDVTLEVDRSNAHQSNDALKRSDERVKTARDDLERTRGEINSLTILQESLEQRRIYLQTQLSTVMHSTHFTDIQLPDLTPLEGGLEIAKNQLGLARINERNSEIQLQEAQTRYAVYLEQQRTFEQAQARYTQSHDRLEAVRFRLQEISRIEAEANLKLDAASPEIQRLEFEATALNLPAVRASLEGLELTRRELETNFSQATRELSDVRERLEFQRLSLARRETNLEALLQVSRTDNAQCENFIDPEGTPRYWTQRLNIIHARLDQIGLVNPLAATEYASESIRLSQLETNIIDAQEATMELEQALDELERDVTTKLQTAIQRVSASFREYTKDLLAGTGELQVLLDNTGALEGLALIVTPKGKRTRSLHLLSAGERTMAALAFLFALSDASDNARGLPLAVLDEVDAPLDEANIRRFTHFLNILADKGTQFILVTHQKATMEIADALWGVTTDSGGISRTFSIRNNKPKFV